MDFIPDKGIVWPPLGAAIGGLAIQTVMHIRIRRRIRMMRRDGLCPHEPPPPWWRRLVLSVIAAAVSVWVVRGVGICPFLPPNMLPTRTPAFHSPLAVLPLFGEEGVPLWSTARNLCLIYLVDVLYRRRVAVTRTHPIMVALARSAIPIVTMFQYLLIDPFWSCPTTGRWLAQYLTMHVTGLAETTASLLFGIESPLVLSWGVVAFVAVIAWLLISGWPIWQS